MLATGMVEGRQILLALQSTLSPTMASNLGQLDAFAALVVPCRHLLLRLQRNENRRMNAAILSVTLPASVLRLLGAVVEGSPPVRGSFRRNRHTICSERGDCLSTTGFMFVSMSWRGVETSPCSQ